MKYVFWIQSSRGTQEIQTVDIPKNLICSGVKDKLEDWCSGFGAWHVSENFCSYGYLRSTKTTQQKIARYHKAKQRRLGKMDDLIDKNITAKEFDKWLKRNKKALTFPFK